jgi:FAD/FMN-containing dehydrogenase
MRRILHVGSDFVTVQPGVVLGALNRYLAAFGRIFGPDPAAGGVTTMGSVLALDGSGSQWMRYGSARDHVRSLQIVLADGESFEASRHPITDDPDIDPVPRRREIVRRVAELVQREEGLIQAHTPRALVNRCGYHLKGIVEDGQLNLAQLLVGSEGTLALITQATIGTEAAPKHRGLVALFFDRLESAAIAAQEAVERGAVACDLVDRRILALARDTDPRYARTIPRDTEAMLVVEQQGDDARDVQLNLQDIALQIHRRRRLAFGFHLALGEDRRGPGRTPGNVARILCAFAERVENA